MYAYFVSGIEWYLMIVNLVLAIMGMLFCIQLIKKLDNIIENKYIAHFCLGCH